MSQNKTLLTTCSQSYQRKSTLFVVQYHEWNWTASLYYTCFRAAQKARNPCIGCTSLFTQKLHRKWSYLLEELLFTEVSV